MFFMQNSQLQYLVYQSKINTLLLLEHLKRNCYTAPENNLFSDQCDLNLTQKEISESKSSKVCKLQEEIQFEKPQEVKVSKKKKEQKDESDYEPTYDSKKTIQNIEPTYAKKNTQSNIINQIISFACSQQRSESILLKIFQGNAKKVSSFYQILKYIKKSKKKYINRKFLSKTCLLKENQTGYKMLVRMKNKMDVLQIQEFQKAFAIIILYYLKQQVIFALSTSKKICKQTLPEHFQRKRQIYQYLKKSFEKGQVNFDSQQEQL